MEIRYSPGLILLLENAKRITRELGAEAVWTECLVLAMLEMPESHACQSLVSFAVPLPQLRTRLERSLRGHDSLTIQYQKNRRVEYSTRIEKNLSEYAPKVMREQGKKLLSTIHVLCAIIDDESASAGTVLRQQGMRSEDILNLTIDELE